MLEFPFVLSTSFMTTMTLFSYSLRVSFDIMIVIILFYIKRVGAYMRHGREWFKGEREKKEKHIPNKLSPPLVESRMSKRASLLPTID